jgi:thioredoxin 1
MEVIHVEASGFEDEVLKSEKPVLVDFFANWCGPCQMIGPMIEELAQEVDTVKFVKVDVDENPNLAMEYKVVSIPMLLLFKNGEVVKKQIGALPKDEIKKFIEE